MGLFLGVAGVYASKSVYAVEDFFENKMKRIHWMWWPAIGSVVVGIIGYFAPHTMGVGYDNIRNLLAGHVTLYAILALSFLKFISWAIYLGSNTSGSTLAPLFIIGGALGALFGYIILHLFPGSEINMSTCALIGMAATFTGASRAILTAIVFAFETTMQAHGLLPLIGACTASYLISFFLMKGGTLYTEKVERLGVHTPTFLDADILQKLVVSDVLGTDMKVLSSVNTIGDVRSWIKTNIDQEEGTSFIVVNENSELLGIVKRKDIFSKQIKDRASITLLINEEAPFIYPNNELSIAVDIMDRYQTDILPVIKRGGSREVTGVLSHKNIFSAYGKRRDEDKIYKQAIPLEYRKIKVVLRDRHFFRWNNWGKK